MTVDVEDYFQVSAFDNRISRADWASIPSRLERNVDRILELFDANGVKGTFFTLGWVAEHQPQVIRSIAAEGHEVASHGRDHSRIGSLTPAEFRRDVADTRKLLEDTSGTAVLGYRAPSFSLSGDTLWAHEILAETGYAYSSSIFPIEHDHYGLPQAPRFAFLAAGERILEVPLTTIAAFGRNWPCAGGGYFRLLPLRYFKWGVGRVNRLDQMPAVFYFHPWELDPGQPRMSGISLKTRFRHYVNLHRFDRRLQAMLGKFPWGRMDQIFGISNGSAAPGPRT